MNKYINWLLLAAIVSASFFLMLNASLQESATMDELAHIPAGYGYVKYLDYRLNPEHPPLVKTLAALPLLFHKLNFPTDKSAWQNDINGQWEAGNQFLYESGNDADKIIQWSRLGPMLLTLLLIIFIYIWGKELMGRWWALFPAFLFSLSPTVLAHGHYVTTDLGAALGIFIATYYFVKFLLGPSQKYLIFAGLAFGVAQLMKFSAVLLIPFFIFLIVIFYIWKIYYDKQQNKAFHYIKALLLIFIIGYALVYAVYFLFTINYPIEKQFADTKFTLASFAGGPDANWESCKLNLRCLAEINIWMANNKILRPLGEYMLGVLMVMQRSSGGNTGYFLGEVSAVGWWYYFPVLFILKESIPSLILILLAFIFASWRIVKNVKCQVSNVKCRLMDYLGLHFAEFAMISFVIFYWLYSIKSPLNIGIRHILPTMPFIYILTAGAIKKWINGKKAKTKKILIAVLMVWYFAETLLVYPHFLSYFNQFAGGTNNGYRYAVDSNYDWGQDLKRLAKWVNDRNNDNDYNNDIKKIAIDYFGGGNPKYYLGDKAEYWQSSKNNPKYENIGWLAISINTLQNAFGELHPGQSRSPENEYQWLKEIKNPYQPDFKAGKSIFIYKL
ncbi:MAG: glycosyltransferase family 39 protein [bacterium]|nr:glycosyltransferase family 39 protein [bacterium]